MKLEYWALVAVLLVWLLIAWFLGVLLHLQGSDLWILRIGLAVIGIAAVAALWWWLRSRNRGQAGDGQAAAGVEGAAGGTEEVSQLLREANKRLASSAATRGKKVASLPAILLVGESGSGKTSFMGGSGLDAELLAGQVLQGNALVPTRVANVWYARQTIFIEAGGGLLSNPAAWARLVRGLAPATMRSLLGKPQPPRAVVVAFDLEAFTRPGASDAVGATLRNLQARLREVSQFLGISFPVYVIFGKADRLPFFAEYVDNLTNDEILQVVGATVPIEGPTGVYGEQQAHRLTTAFDELMYSIADKRSEILRREHNAGSLPGIYEFPRELRKLRTAVVQFLVEACRPSQLRSGPLLRGFYFAGIRTVTESTFTPVAERAAPSLDPNASGIGATRVFSVRPGAGRGPELASQAPVTRQVPQWVFLSHIFTDVLLQDRAALGASASSTQTSFLRRLLLSLATAIFVVCIIGFTISYFGNRALENQVLTAAQGISAAEGAGTQLASLDALQRLEKLRQSLGTLRQYQTAGPPLHLRWGLYVGDSLYPAASKVYFNRFYQLLFAQTQNALLATLRGLPAAPGPNDAYGPAYQALKAYLISTSHHEKSSREFLSPVLLNTWVAGRDIDQDRKDLAQRQFDFYSGYLIGNNPFSSEAETAPVQHARDYLSKFAGAERVYQSMLAAASDKNKPINFNRDFPGSAAVIVNSHEVPGAFTKGGWSFMQDAIQHPDRYFSGEEWVLGPQSAAQLNTANLTATLKTRYLGDFIDQWRAFLRASAFAGYRSIADADHKLDLLSGNQSPLLELFWEVSQNTSVDPDVAKAFQPPQVVVPASLQNQYVGPSNQNYLGALLNLKGAVDQFQTAPPGTPPAQVQSSAVSARASTDQVAQTFAPDRDGHVDDAVKKLMLAPILSIDNVLPKPGAALNGQGAGLCSQFRQLVNKYPFNPNSTVQATMQEFSGFFQPGTGALWMFYDQSLKPMLVLRGSEYVAQPGTATLTPDFVRYFNRAAALSQAVYAGSPQPHLAYTLKSYTPEGLQGVTLTIDGQTLTSAAGQPASKQFTWPGPGAPSATLLYKIGGQDFRAVLYNDPWAIFHFFAGAQRAQQQGSIYTIDWVPETSGQPTTLANGKVLDMRFDLDMGGAPPIFLKSYWSGFGCVSRVAQ